MHPYDAVVEFHKLFKHPVSGPITKGAIDLRMSLLSEEFDEVTEELLDEEFNPRLPIDKVALTKELADLIYVAYGMAIAFGLPINEVFDEVHKSNMRKVWPDGKVHYREDGKVLKPEGFEKPDYGKFFEGV